MKNLFSKPFQLLLALGVCFVISFSMLMFGDGWSIDMVVPSAFLFFGVYCLYKIIDPDKELNNRKKNVVVSNKSEISPSLAGERITPYVAGVTFENRQELVRQIKIGDNVTLIPG